MARTWRERCAARQARAEQRAARLLALLPRARDLLVERYGASRVTLFGSLATGEYRECSDVDLAVEGLAVLDYFPALSDLMELLGGPVDLVCREQAPPSLAERITEEGRDL
jgi:predicted nucleotidyltransferase